MLLNSVAQSKLLDLSTLHAAMNCLSGVETGVTIREKRAMMAGLEAQLVIAKASLGLYQSQASDEAVSVEMRRRNETPSRSPLRTI